MLCSFDFETQKHQLKNKPNIHFFNDFMGVRQGLHHLKHYDLILKSL